VDIYGWQEEQRAALNRLDRQVANGLNGAYFDLLTRARAEMAGYRNAYEQFVARNGPPAAGIEDRPGGRHYVFQQERLESVIKQLAGDMETYHETATGVITDAQRAALRQARVGMEAFGPVAAPGDQYAMGLSFATLPEEAIRSVVGMTSNGSPLATLMQQRARNNWQDAADTLRAGMGLGYGPEKIATSLDDSLGQAHWKNLMLARTEVIRAHHEAQRMQVLQNADLLAGWRWSAATDSRTCPICWANHNKVFPIHEVDANSGPDLLRAQHRGFDDFLTIGSGAKTDKGSVDASALPEQAAGNPRESLDTALRLAERSTWKDPRETLRILDADGNEVFVRQGSESAVTMSDEEVAQYAATPGLIATHNHPSGWDHIDSHEDVTPYNVEDYADPGTPAWRGTGLSRNDIDLAVSLGLGEMRAVSPAYAHVLRPRVGEQALQREVLTAYDRHERAVRIEFMEAIRTGRMTVQEANTRHHHEVLSRVSAETGAVYSRIGVREALGGFTDEAD
jgi:hypothetical protein